mgnify:CR=1 FL=1
MIEQIVNTNKKKFNLVTELYASSPTKVRLVAFDPYKKGAIYMDRWKTIDGNEKLELRLPQSPKRLMVRIMPESSDLEVVGFKAKKLLQFPACYSRQKKILNFVKFAQKFSENLFYLPTGTYYSDNRKYRIDLFNVITDDETNRPLRTPARISNNNGRIEVSKSHFIKMTIPMRMAILLHEFSHFYLNKETTNEVEADLNALKIYLALGYPYIEAHKSFIHTFKGNQTQQNIDRYEHIKKFVKTFEKSKYSLCMI